MRDISPAGGAIPEPGISPPGGVIFTKGKNRWGQQPSPELIYVHSAAGHQGRFMKGDQNESRRDKA